VTIAMSIDIIFIDRPATNRHKGALIIIIIIIFFLYIDVVSIIPTVNNCAILQACGTDDH